MDLSPKLLTDVQFREQWRGYNPDEVDEFLERVAAGVEELQQRLTDALERASNAERRLLERSDEDEIRRTLVLAQRTAVASMEEARAEADRLVSEAEARCRQLVAEAEARAAELDADIATRRRIELGDLAEERAALQLDVEHLRTFLHAERTRLADVLRAQLESIENGYSLAELPKLSEVAAPPAEIAAPVEMSAPEPIEAAPVEEQGLADREPQPLAVDPEVAENVSEPVSAVDELRLAREELADALRRAGVGTDDGAGGDAPLPVESQPAPAAPYDAPVPPEEDAPLWRDDLGAEDDDPFLAELRRAVVDTEPLGPRDDDHQAPATPMRLDEEDDVSSGGFFRRSRRRP